MPPQRWRRAQTRRQARARSQVRRGAEIVWIVAIACGRARVLYGPRSRRSRCSDSFCSPCHAQQQTASEGHRARRRQLRRVPWIDELLRRRRPPPGPGLDGDRRVRSRQPVDGAARRERRCLACHQKAMQGKVRANGIIMSHKEVVAANWACTTCHADTAHGGSATTPGYSMDTCLSCHYVSPTDVKSCDKCHEGDRPTARAQLASGSSSTVANWRTTHGLGDLNTCKACHTPDKCIKCHNMAVPHPDDFRNQHGSGGPRAPHGCAGLPRVPQALGVRRLPRRADAAPCGLPPRTTSSS